MILVCINPTVPSFISVVAGLLIKVIINEDFIIEVLLTKGLVMTLGPS